MNSLVLIATEIAGICLYSLLIAAALYGFTLIFLQYSSVVKYWRDYWLVLIVMSVLPIIYIFVSFYSPQLTVFDINKLQLFNENIMHVATLEQIQLFRSEPKKYSVFNVAILVITLILIVGVIYRSYRLIRQIRKVNQLINTSKSIIASKESLNSSQFKQLIRLQKKSKIKIFFTEKNISPFVFQFKNNVMVLPLELFRNFNQKQINLIIRHELVHLKNHDSLVILISYLINCILWFNPFVKKFQQSMNMAIEVSCDNDVLSRKPNLRRIYAQTMLKILHESATKTSNHMVAAFSIKTHRSLTMRINNIMKPTKHNVKLKIKKMQLWGSAVTVACITFFVQPQLNAATHESPASMINPVLSAKVSSLYGVNNRFHQFHKGIDLAVKTGTPIVAVTSGIIRISTDVLKDKKNYGKIIIIDHADGLHSVYAHLNSRKASVGEKVKAGQLIGYVGQTGKASGPHLHLEILKNNEHVDPSTYIQF